MTKEKLVVKVPDVDETLEREKRKLYSKSVAKTPKEVVDNLL